MEEMRRGWKVDAWGVNDVYSDVDRKGSKKMRWEMKRRLEGSSGNRNTRKKKRRAENNNEDINKSQIPRPVRVGGDPEQKRQISKV